MPAVLLRLAWRGFANPAYWNRWGERFGLSLVAAPAASPIWIHAVSVGEAQAAVPLMRALQERYPNVPLIVTTTTPTGSDRVQQVVGASVTHQYAPYDLPGSVQRFLNHFRPRLAVMMETELWPNIIHHCRRRNIPLLLANARLSARSRDRYARFGAPVREMLAEISAVAAQTEDDADRLVELGLQRTRLTVTGSVKFDVNLPASLREEAEVMRRCFGVDRGVWIAASTHEGEDETVLEAFTQVLAKQPRCLLVIVPRHPERFARVASLCRKQGFVTVLRSDRPESCDAAQVFVGDTMGELPVFYAASDVAFVGGSLVATGGHNVLEPAAMGVPVLAGPLVFNFAEIMQQLCVAGAARTVTDAPSLAQAVTGFLENADGRHAAGEQGRKFVADNRGALDRLLSIVAKLLDQ